jgi:hypothetical protein
MHAHRHTTAWGIHIGGRRARNVKGQYHELKDWWAAHKTARHEARLATLKARCNAKCEAVRPLHAATALDLVASTHAFSTTTAICDLTP